MAGKPREQLYNLRVELRSRVFAEHLDGALVAEALAIRAVSGHRVVGIGDVNDARLDRRLLAFLSGRIAAAVPVLVMQLHSGEVRRETAHTFQDAPADDRMLLDLS